MAVVVESFSEFESGTSGDETVLDKPSGTAEGDTLLAVLCFDQAVVANISAPDGTWSLVESEGPTDAGAVCVIYAKVAGSSEAASYTFTNAGAGRTNSALFRVSGADTTTPVNASDTTLYNTLDSSDVVCPSISPDVAGCLLVTVGVSEAGGRVFSESGSQAIVWQDPSSGSNFNFVSAVVGSEALASSGATGTRSYSRSNSGRWVSASIAIAPAAGGGGNHYTIEADGGSFTLTGQAAGLLHGRVLAAAAGAFTLTGYDVTFPRTYVMAAAAGSFTLTGQAVALLWGHRLGADAGAFVLDGQDAGLLHGYVIAAAAGEFAFTGQDVAFSRGYVLAAGAGDFALTGQAVNLLWAHRLNAEAGAFVLTGMPLWDEGGADDPALLLYRRRREGET